MLSLSIGLFLVAMATLMLELILIRVFDVIWYANMAYMVITLAMFSFGLAGVYASLLKSSSSKWFFSLPVKSALMGLFAIFILPVLNYLQFDLDLFSTSITDALGYFLVVYFCLALPFFLGGLILTDIFSNFASSIRRLYFWDLVGASLGCVAIVPLIPRVGPGGILFFVCAFSFFASALFSKNNIWRGLAVVIGVGTMLMPVLKSDGYFEFEQHMNKRNTVILTAMGRKDFSYWDPTSKIDVYRMGGYNWVAYDGGTQSSNMIGFNGDFESLRETLPQEVTATFTAPGVVVSHYLKRDSDQEVLIIGSAAGQETKAALTYGASQVDAIELVGAVIALGKTKYDKFLGGLFNHPKVNMQKGEGRSFLRSTDKKYDIIQMMSNHTSSSIAAGTGAMQTTYLQTAEAYREYFSHLKDDGILHINHHIYPKMVATAALAWKQMGFENFQEHVFVTEFPNFQDNLPTMMIKMTPWTKTEVADAMTFFQREQLVVDPINPETSYLSKDFFSGEFPDQLEEKIPFRVGPSTDNRPFFNLLRKEIKPLEPDADVYLNVSTTGLLNSQLRGAIPMDIMHLVVSGGGAIIFALIFLLVPLLFSKIGRSPWKGKTSFLAYFACLGGGFIVFELVFIHLFMKLIGFPLYTYSVVVFTFLFGAGLGSFASETFSIDTQKKWWIPFLGIVVSGALILLFNYAIFEHFLQSPVLIRILVAVVMIFPLAFFLGMPFPLGILAVKGIGAGAVAWGWAFNALFTVIGSVACVITSILFGFRETVMIAIVIYCLALLFFNKIRQIEPA